jgi:hypothetical protein
MICLEFLDSVKDQNDTKTKRLQVLKASVDINVATVAEIKNLRLTETICQKYNLQC